MKRKILAVSCLLSAIVFTASGCELLNSILPSSSDSSVNETSSVVSSEEIHIHATVYEFLHGSECADIALWHHIAVFIPEIPDVTEKIHSLSVFRQRTQKVCKAALAGGWVSHLKTQMDV